MHGIARIVAVACIFASALPACSDSRLSKDELIAEADQICARANDESTAMGEPTDEEQFSDMIARAKEVQDEAITDLRELAPPAEDQGTYDSMLDALEEATSYLPDFQAAVASKNEKEMQELGTKIGEAASRAQEIATEYGFEVCASSRIARES